MTDRFAEGYDPKPFGLDGLMQEQAIRMTGDFGKADPLLSEIPITTSRANTRVCHGGYDIRIVAADQSLPAVKQQLLDALRPIMSEYAAHE